MKMNRIVCVLAILHVISSHDPHAFVQTSLAASDYASALTKLLLYFEGQRSGKLPPNQRVKWRGDSALKDGSDVGIDLSGGYYDAGDNVKFGFPMAFTITMLSWSTLEFRAKLKAKGELGNTLNAIRWGTDYFIKAHSEPHVLYGQVGDGDSDHACWMRPEDMTTPRGSYRIDDQNPGSDLAAETAAAFAAASIAFGPSDQAYSAKLLVHAKQLFDFASNHQGLYQSSIPSAGGFYASSGFQDELVWAAAWLYHATDDKSYLDFLQNSGNSGGVKTQLSWDDKYVGAQVLVAKLLLGGKVASGVLYSYKNDAEQFICNCIQKGNNNVRKTPGGLLWFQEWNNLQYTGTAAFIAAVYAQYLTSKHASIQCPGGIVQPPDLAALVQSQADYILGANPKNVSYLVGYGTSFPQKIHHRGSSIVSTRNDQSPVSCKDGFQQWYNRDAPNPNLLVGAIVGGPDNQDGYNDDRSNYQSNEAATVNISPFVGVLASLA
ncbi:hypothetical protein MLD38_021271 [Melastoma candidum]|uniref:Uncharacterized protein n=1 Tax=Melastoma candidum TaxID=119954 RepID=A0ACB9QGT3_9MYRT|nr:hypothetical protein MLD38_021271 [Melastoma candidum]